MSRWDASLPEADTFVVFPPADQAAAYAQSKERLVAFLKARLPHLTFEIADLCMGDEAVLIPICGEAGEEGRGMFAKLPSHSRVQEIRDQLATFKFERGGLS